MASRPGLPGGKSLFFASPKKSNQKKGDPTICGVIGVRVQIRRAYGSPSRVRCLAPQRNWRPTPITHLAVLSPAGVSCKLASLKQARALIRLALRSSAQPEGVGELNSQYRTAQIRARRVLVPRVRIHFFKPVLAGPSSADGGGRSGQTCLSEASCLDRRRNRAAQVARSEAKGPRLRVAFSFAYFAFGEAKEK